MENDEFVIECPCCYTQLKQRNLVLSQDGCIWRCPVCGEMLEDADPAL